MKEPLYEVFEKTSVDYIANGNVQATCKTYKVQFVARIQSWKCSCEGYKKSGGKNICKHIRATQLRVIMELGLW